MKTLSNLNIVFCTSIFVHSVISQYGQPCGLLGPSFPAPTQPHKSKLLNHAFESIQQTIERAISSPKKGDYGSIDGESTSFSIGIFSSAEDDLLFEFNHDAPANSNPEAGVKHVDSNTIYRIGSVSKLLTVYLWLLELGDENWNEPVTKFVPQLRDHTHANPQQGSSGQFEKVAWDGITIGALASQLSGIARDARPARALGEVEQSIIQGPKPDIFKGKMCQGIPCNFTQLFENLMTEPTFVAPFETPIYSNSAFSVLGSALEYVTGEQLPELFQSGLVKRLGLKHTTYSTPATTDGSFIPLDKVNSTWNANTHTLTPAGGYFSTIQDLAIMGRSILNSSHLSSSLTRRWLKPHSFTYDERSAVGAPWEIFRAPISKEHNKTTWFYSKNGDLGSYATLFGLLPEYNVGFAILSGHHGLSGDTVSLATMTNIMIDKLYPALEQSAKQQATENFAGSYHDRESNSSISVIAKDNVNQLILDHWTYNGTDILKSYAAYTSLPTKEQGGIATLAPTSLTSKYKNGKLRKIAWRLVISTPTVDDNITNRLPYSKPCLSWGGADVVIYGKAGMDQFTFLTKDDGSAETIIPEAFGTKLSKTD